jgi:hypothetical protein
MAWPEVIVPELSGPSESLDGSTPETLKEFVLNAPFAEPPAESPAPAEPLLPLLSEIVPDSFTSLSVSEPTAPETSLRSDTVVTADDFSVPVPAAARTSRLTLVPCWPDRPPWKLKRCPLPDPAAGACVTVTSVPTPYSD